MSKLYGVFNEGKAEGTKKEWAPELPKEEYAKRMQEWRTALFSMTNGQTLKAIESPENYECYFDLMVQPDYQVTNTLLVIVQYPDAQLLKEGTRWRENNKFIRSDEKDKGIQILEPGSECIRRDGMVGIDYNPKYVCNISQLNGKAITIPAPNYSNKEIINTLTHGTTTKPEVATAKSDLPSPVYYTDDAKKIYAKAGLKPQEMMTGLVRKYCTMECLKSGINREDSQFTAASVSYIICQEYSIKGCDESLIQHAGGYFEGLDRREVKGKLEDIKGLYKSVSDRMEHGIYTKQQERTDK